VKNYILKRLLLMGVTLFGISLITFVIVQNAPGDPAAARAQMGGPVGGQQISKKSIEDTRRLYYLDKPVLLNLEPDDRGRVLARLIPELRSADEEERKDAAGELLEIGTVALPSLVAALGKAEREIDAERLADLLGQIVPRAAPAPDLPPRARAEHWRAFLAEAGGRFTEERAREAATAYLAGEARAETETGTALARVLESGSFAVPFLVDAARSEEHPARGRAQLALATILRKPWVVPADEANRTRLESLYERAREKAGAEKGAREFPARDRWVAEEREREARTYASRWTAYWRDNQDRFIEYSPWQERLRMLTQTRFARWFGMLLRGDFGESYRLKRPVTEVILERLPVSLQLSLISAFVAYAIAIPIGIHSATRAGSRLDRFLTAGLFVLYSLPSFFVAQMLIIFTTGGDYPLIFPTGHLTSSPEDMPFGSPLLDRLWHLVLPIAVLSYASFAYISRQMRAGMLETVRQDYIRTARAKGLSERKVIFKHALRNSMIPILTLLGSLLPHLLGGSVIAEEIFTIHGMGKLSFESILNRDYPLIMGISFFSAVLTLLGIFLSDLSYALVDPRISYE